MIRILVASIILLLAIPLGNYLAKKTKEELKKGKLWFKIIIVISLIGGVISLFQKNDTLFFTFLFIAIVTSRSLDIKCHK
jgi:hypothetical protein